MAAFGNANEEGVNSLISFFGTLSGIPEFIGEANITSAQHERDNQPMITISHHPQPHILEIAPCGRILPLPVVMVAAPVPIRSHE